MLRMFPLRFGLTGNMRRCSLVRESCVAGAHIRFWLGARLSAAVPKRRRRTFGRCETTHGSDRTVICLQAFLAVVNSFC